MTTTKQLKHYIVAYVFDGMEQAEEFEGTSLKEVMARAKSMLDPKCTNISVRLEGLALSSQCNQLNAVIHKRNLCRNGARFINAKVEGRSVTVQNIMTDERVTFVSDGSFYDGYGYKIKLS